jgi:mono/diheme cytochrome c family protein
MPPWALSQGGPLTGEQVAALVNGIEENWAKPVSLHGAAPSYAGEGQTGDEARGKKLFLRDCFACHAKGAIVGPVTDPNYLTLVSDQNLRTSIIVGRPDLGMPDYRVLNLGRALGDQDIADLVTYLASLRPANGATK